LQYLDPIPEGNFVLTSTNLNELIGVSQKTAEQITKKMIPVDSSKSNQGEIIFVNEFLKNIYYSNTISRWIGKFILFTKSRILFYYQRLKYNIVIWLKWHFFL